MLIMRCDTCGEKVRPAGFVYDENPHLALIRWLRKDQQNWQYVDQDQDGPHDLCPSCAKKYADMLDEQERQRREFFKNDPTT